MEIIGQNHFFDSLEPLANEQILWEGGPAPKGIFVHFLDIIGIGLGVLLFVGFMISVMFTLAFSIETSNKTQPQAVGQEQEVTVQDTAESQSSSPTETPRASESTFSVKRFIGSLGLFILLWTVVLIIIIWLRINNFWYVITTERICIQSGILTKNIIAIDLDKVISVISSQSMFERWFDLQSVEIVHAGMKMPYQNSLLWFINPYEIKYIHVRHKLASNLINIWLPRDNRKA